jgi:hypothetical protein
MVKILFDMPGEDFRAELLAQLGTRMCIDAHNSREIAKNDADQVFGFIHEKYSRAIGRPLLSEE